MDAPEFERWYWPVESLNEFCKQLGLSASGSKAELRERVLFSLQHPREVQSNLRRKSNSSTFNWAKETLDRDTVITDNVSFGPNVRCFFKSAVGARFTCHSDFMDWMRANAGATLGDAIDAWHVLEQRKNDPSFRREIATCNNYLQYLRDARDKVTGMTLEEAKSCWDFKKIRPARNGIVVFEMSDLTCLE
ncbi:DUF6434 domain-containing protein [Cognatiyoonia sp. IB215446]|uniref:DUF6434 domain-containing protein n=1 Tax=Cognatiyoonia sp. IB215446 TaxID=3097355 RepID=UPI002A163CD3|nr:DUF6434 domain-containing protein [Cognatiyoonia sp. IB215446]MDX8350450.1 DUF6434 domain-containing protein [Cognatiyoonia sp. IB215446]